MTNLDRRTESIARLIDCSYRQLNRWCHEGILGEDPKWTPGSGRKVVFDDVDVERAWVCARLTELGAELSVLGPVIEQLSDWGRPKPKTLLVVFDNGACLLWGRASPMPPEPCWCIPLLDFDQIIAEKSYLIGPDLPLGSG